MLISKVIHQSWKSEDIPHEVYSGCWVESWSAKNPDWHYRLWTDADNRALVSSSYPEYLEFYDGLNVGIKRADFSRFLYMHKFGGVYADLDFVCLRELTPILYGASIVVGQLSPANCHYRIPNAFMASEPGLDFWLQVATDAMNAPPHEHGVERHAGPFRLQWGLEKYKPAGLRILDTHLVYPIDWIHYTDWQDGIHYRPGLVDQARRIKDMDLETIQREFPQSFAVTTWAHNW